MEIIPVIDILGGKAVRAVRGNREQYHPISSLLCKSSDPVHVAQAYMELHTFNTLYIADLDAILGHGNNLSLIRKLKISLPNTRIWLDGGYNAANEMLSYRQLDIDCVIGSERLQGLSQYESLRAKGDENSDILSLDFNHQGFAGPQELLLNPDIWPQRLICMTLRRVGSYEGPDERLIRTIASQADTRKLYAAGGIRDMHDIERVAASGASGALIASALHDQKIDSADLRTI